MNLEKFKKQLIGDQKEIKLELIPPIMAKSSGDDRVKYPYAPTTKHIMSLLEVSQGQDAMEWAQQEFNSHIFATVGSSMFDPNLYGPKVAYFDIFILAQLAYTQILKV
jgi:hypothetical protein